jgi:hypothetical protein
MGRMNGIGKGTDWCLRYVWCNNWMVWKGPSAVMGERRVTKPTLIPPRSWLAGREMNRAFVAFG